MEVGSFPPSRGRLPQSSWTAAETPISEFDISHEERKFATTSSITPGGGSTESTSPCSADDDGDDNDDDDTVSEDMLMDLPAPTGNNTATATVAPRITRLPSTTLTASPAVSSPSTLPLEVDSDSAAFLEIGTPPLARAGAGPVGQVGLDLDDSSISSDDSFSLETSRRRRRRRRCVLCHFFYPGNTYVLRSIFFGAASLYSVLLYI